MTTLVHEHLSENYLGRDMSEWPMVSCADSQKHGCRISFLTGA